MRGGVRSCHDFTLKYARVCGIMGGMEPEQVKIIDNVNHTLAADLRETIIPKSKMQVAAACFSIYAFQELKENLKNIEQLQLSNNEFQK